MNLPKPTRVRDEAYLEFVRGESCIGLNTMWFSSEDVMLHTAECCWVTTGRSEANHIRRGAQTGMRTKPADRRTLPFCTTLHTEYTRLGHKAFCRKYEVFDDLFESEIRRMNAEYLRRHPIEIKRQRSTRVSVVQHVAVRCVCGGEHKPTGGRIRIDKGEGQTLTFWCPRLKDYLQATLGRSA